MPPQKAHHMPVVHEKDGGVVPDKAQNVTTGRPRHIVDPSALGQEKIQHILLLSTFRSEEGKGGKSMPKKKKKGLTQRNATLHVEGKVLGNGVSA